VYFKYGIEIYDSFAEELSNCDEFHEITVPSSISLSTTPRIFMSLRSGEVGKDKTNNTKINRRTYINVLPEKDENLKTGALGIITKFEICF
jgi:hypothetical protein